jgi:hypothetical protein
MILKFTWLNLAMTLAAEISAKLFFCPLGGGRRVRCKVRDRDDRQDLELARGLAPDPAFVARMAEHDRSTATSQRAAEGWGGRAEEPNHEARACRLEGPPDRRHSTSGDIRTIMPSYWLLRRAALSAD